MSKHFRFIPLLLFAVIVPAFAQTPPLSKQLYQFSPLGEIIARNLGLQDKNSGGVIDKGAGEGYEAFTAKYGNADIGFHANGVIYGAGNSRLEEPEIVNHYYTHIRFKPEFAKETDAIENEIKAYIYAHNIPLVWLDDQQGTVMNVVNNILGIDWQNQPTTLSQAKIKYEQVLNTLNNGHPVRGLTGKPNETGHFQLPEFAHTKSGYCFEVAQFGFWFFFAVKNKVSCYVHSFNTVFGSWSN